MRESVQRKSERKKCLLLVLFRKREELRDSQGRLLWRRKKILQIFLLPWYSLYKNLFYFWKYVPFSLFNHPLELWVCIFSDNECSKFCNKLYLLSFEILYAIQCSFYIEFSRVAQMQIFFLEQLSVTNVSASYHADLSKLYAFENLCFPDAWYFSEVKITANSVSFQSHLPLLCLGPDRFRIQECEIVHVTRSQ